MIEHEKGFDYLKIYIKNTYYTVIYKITWYDRYLTFEDLPIKVKDLLNEIIEKYGNKD
jgi:hypothetical protein